ncbi:hypothetical protein BD410DRAFT_792065 [Rickenella mellea]|uniref:Uncharacterized protein n=1 Tax=Rickenella mellea TaxID=50990 RepID=A0A4Y7PVN3_9AGAM|nr:hypothetical protein BD410DRAFT_792065 [Rickenella mellea]
MSSADDPRDASLETKLTMPKTWVMGGPDGLSALSMLFAGAVMVTRNRWLGWPATLLGISSFINQHPLRTKDGGSSWTGLAMAGGSLATGYLPMFIISSLPPPGQVPLPTTP